MLTTSVKIGNKYNYTEEKIEQALTFLRTTDFTGMEPGKVAIDGDRIFAEIQEYTTKDPKDCRFETHRKYYDIQYVAEEIARLKGISVEEVLTQTEINAKQVYQLRAVS